MYFLIDASDRENVDRVICILVTCAKFMAVLVVDDTKGIILCLPYAP